MTWKLRRTAQCAGCPWIKGNDPLEIPGYCATKHGELISTIAQPADYTQVTAHSITSMACHETEAAHCVGWLANQLGPGNNIALRLHVRTCTNVGQLRLRGEQHRTFNDTLPEESSCVDERQLSQPPER
jgi:hypothetical protein